MTAARPRGLDLAQAAQQLVTNHIAATPNNPPTLDALSETLSHLSGTQSEWREAVAFLAAQLHTATRVSNAARAQDAQFALSQIRAQVLWFEGRHGEFA